MDPVVELQETYPYSPEIVWQAITDQVELGEWLMKSNFEPTVGFEFRFEAPPNPHWRGYVVGTVLEADPPKRLSYSWDGDDATPPSKVTWTLEAVEGGTKLSLEHRGFVGAPGRKSYEGLKSGWTKKMKETILASMERLNARK